jgi:hypothetical protein
MSTESYATISSPFPVKNLSKFIVWAKSLGLLIQHPAKPPCDRVIISPEDADEWHHIEVPDEVDMDSDDAFWNWFAPQLGAHLPKGECAILYESWYNARKSITSVGGGVYIINSKGAYTYGNLNDLVLHLWKEKMADVSPAALHSSGLPGEPLAATEITQAPKERFRAHLLTNSRSYRAECPPGQQWYTFAGTAMLTVVAKSEAQAKRELTSVKTPFGVMTGETEVYFHDSDISTAKLVNIYDPHNEEEND